MKSLKGSQDALQRVLQLITTLEEEESDLALNARYMLDEMVKDIAYTFTADKDLHSFDKVFTRTGWTDQGIRYCRNEKECIRGRLVMGPKIVQFQSDTKESWVPL